VAALQQPGADCSRPHGMGRAELWNKPSLRTRPRMTPPHGGELRQAAGAVARAAADKRGVTRLQHDNPRNVA